MSEASALALRRFIESLDAAAAHIATARSSAQRLLAGDLVGDEDVQGRLSIAVEASAAHIEAGVALTRGLAAIRKGRA